MTIVPTIAAAVVGAAVLEYLRVPAGAIIGSMVGVALLRVTPITVSELPGAVRFGAFVAIGWMIGQTLTSEVLGSLWSRAWVIGGSAILLLAFGGVLAASVVKLGLMDPATSFLATSPGGLSQMTALSAAVGADTALVVTLHVVRVTLVILASPLILRFLPAP